MRFMEIRHAQKKDLPELMQIYADARLFMKEHGNAHQWEDHYPSLETITEDIDQQQSYVCIENDQIIGTFVFFIREDPTYQTIQGKWSSAKTYGVIHRIAGKAQAKGIAKACFKYCFEQIDYVRIDTHEDNLPMQNVLKKYGFCPCGTIYLENGDPRLAFDCLKQSL